MKKQVLGFSGAVLAFDALGDDGALRVGVWDRFATYGEGKQGIKIKDGGRVHFTPETFTVMVNNWFARGQALSMCLEHRSALGGQVEAPAAAFYSALAVVDDSGVLHVRSLPGSDQGVPDVSVFHERCRNYPPPLNSPGGLWGFRSHITPKGESPTEGLANYRGISPFFTMNGTDEQERPIGPVIFDVAAVNMNFQGGCELTFAAAKSTAAPGRTTLGAPMDDEMMKRFGIEAGDDDVAKAEKMKKFWADHDGAMAKLSAYEGKETPAEEAEEAKKMSAKLAAVEASNKALMSRLAAVEASEKARAAEAAAAKDREVNALADAAVAGGYPAEAKDSLVAFARVDFEAAKKLAAPHMKGAPAHLFGRLTAAGAPVGVDAKAAREDSAPKPIRMHRGALGNVIAPDEELADAAMKMAQSTDADEKAKIDAVLQPHERTQLYARLIAAQKIVAAARPDLVETAERAGLSL